MRIALCLLTLDCFAFVNKSNSLTKIERTEIVNISKRLLKRLLLGAFFTLMSSNVFALPITGQMEMTGGFFAVDRSGVVVSAANLATGIDFDFFGFDAFRVTSAEGDFAGLAGQVGNITDFQFDPFVAPIADFWTIDKFAFDMTNVVRGTSSDPVNFLVLNGVGMLTAAGFEDTSATWAFTGDTTGSGIFSWSASSASVPEPGVLALLSIGLIGFGVRNRV